MKPSERIKEIASQRRTSNGDDWHRYKTDNQIRAVLEYLDEREAALWQRLNELGERIDDLDERMENIWTEAELASDREHCPHDRAGSNRKGDKWECPDCGAWRYL